MRVTAELHIVDENGELEGPLSISQLRARVLNDQLREEDVIVMPNGERKWARDVLELQTAFAAVRGAPEPPKEARPEASVADFFSGVGAGALTGLGCGMPMAALSLTVLAGVIASIGGGSVAALSTIFIVVGIWIGIGAFIGTVLSTIHAVIMSSDVDTYIWDTKHAMIVGGAIGFIIGLLFLILVGGGLIGIIGLAFFTIILVVMTRIIAKIYDGVFNAG